MKLFSCTLAFKDILIVKVINHNLKTHFLPPSSEELAWASALLACDTKCNILLILPYFSDIATQ